MQPKGQSFKPLKFYIAGTFTNQDEIKKMMQIVLEKGHQITLDWTKHTPIKPYEQNTAAAQRYITEDLTGVQKCDVFVLIPDDKGGKTQFTELGVAILTQSVKRIFVVGSFNQASLSFFHPKVERVKDIEEVFVKLNES